MAVTREFCACYAQLPELRTFKAREEAVVDTAPSGKDGQHLMARVDALRHGNGMLSEGVEQWSGQPTARRSEARQFDGYLDEPNNVYVPEVVAVDDIIRSQLRDPEEIHGMEDKILSHLDVDLDGMSAYLYAPAMSTEATTSRTELATESHEEYQGKGKGKGRAQQQF